MVRLRAVRCVLALIRASDSASRALMTLSRIRMRGSGMSAGDGQALPLATGQIGEFFLDVGFVAVEHYAR